MASIEYKTADYGPYATEQSRTLDLMNSVINSLDSLDPTILTRTSDTGQLIPSSLSFPLATTIGLVHGYVCYKFEDAVGPLYLKIEFMNAPGANELMNIRYTLGKGTNGSGTITDQISQVQIQGSISYTTHLSGNDRQGWHQFSVGQGYLSILIFGHNNINNISYNNWLYCFSRPKNQSGVVSGDFLVITCSYRRLTNGQSSIQIYNITTNNILQDYQIGANSFVANPPGDNGAATTTDLSKDVGRFFYLPHDIPTYPYNRLGEYRVGKLHYFINNEYFTDDNFVIAPYNGKKSPIIVNGVSYMPQSFVTGTAPYQTCLFVKWD